MADHVFVSYSHEDQVFVLELARRLKERGAPIWIDAWDIPPTADWDLTIDNALYECAHFLIVLSPAAVASREVRGELRTALDEDKPVVPVLYQQCRLPRQLRMIHYIDFSARGADDEGAVGQVLRALGLPEPPTRPQEQPRAVPRPKEKLIGEVVRYFDGLRVAGVQLSDNLRVGDVVRFAGPYTDFAQQAESIEHDYQRVSRAPAGAQIGLLVDRPVQVGDSLYKVTGQAERAVSAEGGGQEILIGTVLRYYAVVGAAGVELNADIRIGDTLRIRGQATDFLQQAESIEIDRQPVSSASAGDRIGLLVDRPVQPGDRLYRVSQAGRG